MIIDSCYAEASVTGTGFKPAPMGDRGLGQLAYDKQMRILAATRQKDTAVEVSGNINHGLLTAALLEGIDKHLADFEPSDGKITLTEWLDWAVKDVPELYNQVLSSEKKRVGHQQTPPGSSLQTPVLFNLRRNSAMDIELRP